MSAYAELTSSFCEYEIEHRPGTKNGGEEEVRTLHKSACLAHLGRAAGFWFLTALSFLAIGPSASMGIPSWVIGVPILVLFSLGGHFFTLALLEWFCIRNVGPAKGNRLQLAKMIAMGSPFALYLRDAASEGTRTAHFASGPVFVLEDEAERSFGDQVNPIVPLFALLHHADPNDHPASRRIYAGLDEWEELIQLYMRHARVIVMNVDHLGEGLSKEISWIVERGFTSKTIVAGNPLALECLNELEPRLCKQALHVAPRGRRGANPKYSQARFLLPEATLDRVRELASVEPVDEAPVLAEVEQGDPIAPETRRLLYEALARREGVLPLDRDRLSTTRIRLTEHSQQTTRSLLTFVFGPGSQVKQVLRAFEDPDSCSAATDSAEEATRPQTRRHSS